MISRTYRLFAISLFLFGIIVSFSIYMGNIYLPLRRASIDMLVHPESRERIMVKAWRAFQQRPVFGWGWANFDHAFASIEWPFHVDADVYADKAHSVFLEIIVTAGIFGLCSYLILLFSVFESLRKNISIQSRYFALFFIVYLIHSQTNVVPMAEETLFWAITGLVVGQSVDA